MGSRDDRLLGNALGCHLAEGKSELRVSGLLRDCGSGSAGGDLLSPGPAWRRISLGLAAERAWPWINKLISNAPHVLLHCHY